MSYEVIITEEVAANITVATSTYPITIEYNATNLASGTSYGNANVANYLASGTNTSVIDNIGNISTTGSMAAGGIMVASGNVTGGNIRTAGQVSATGNITGSYFLGNGSQLTGLPVTYGNANVAANLAAFGSNPISTTGNVTAGYFVGNGSTLTNLTAGNIVGTVANAAYSTDSAHALVSDSANAVAGANVTGTVANAAYATTAGTASYVTAAAQANITSVGTLTSLSVSGNITGANVIAPNFQATNSSGGTLKNSGGTTQASWGAGGGDNFAVSVSTNINGTNAQVDISPTGTGHVHIKPTGTGSLEIAPTNAGSINNMVIGNITPLAVNATIMSASGNVTGGNVLSTGNLTSTQQTIVGTANVGTTGNIVVSGRNIATDMKWNPDGATGTAAYTGRVMVGTGWLGNNAVGISSRLASMDTIDRSNTGSTARQIEAETIINLTGNITNTGIRQQAIGGRIRVGGGAAANTVALGQAFGAPFSLAAGQFNLDIGNVSPYLLGNTSVGHATMNGGVLTLNGGSSVGNAYGFVASVVSGGSGAANITNYLGYTSSFATGPNVTGNLFCFYNGNASTLGTHGVLTGNTARSATNYYFLRNDDDVAQNKIGSLRTYHEYRSDLATSGTVNIDKNNGQIQYIAPTGNVTIGDFQNFVTEATDGSTYDQQIDTVTFMIKQGATPYTITMPTGNSSIKYAGNTSAVANTANAVTMISVSAANIASVKTYMVTISPEFI